MDRSSYLHYKHLDSYGFSGGQMGIALAYAIAPLVFAIQVMFDIRVAFLTMLAAIGYSAFCNF